MSARELPQASGKGADVSAWRLLITLGSAGALAGFLLVFVHQVTQPAIQAYKAKMLQLAVQEVLKGPETYETLYVYNDMLTPDLPEGTNGRQLEQVYIGYQNGKRPVGYAIPASGPGFQDTVRLIFGYDPTTGKLLGMKVLENKETPGLGDKIETDADFLENFRELDVSLTDDLSGIAHPIEFVKPGQKEHPWQIDGITGATISSTAIADILEGSSAHWMPRIRRHLDEVRKAGA